MIEAADITSQARAIQEKDEFRAEGWQKIVAPAKVNLFLAVGETLPNGYHQAATVMQALMLHDTLYLRPKTANSPDFDSGMPRVRMVAAGATELPEVSEEDNLVTRAILRCAEGFGRPELTDVEARLVKAIPAQGGLGGASADAAAAVVAMASAAGLDAFGPEAHELAASLGADVPFFLHGGCAYLEGVGGTWVHDLSPLRAAVAVIKPEGGVSTAEAYNAFDALPGDVPADLAAAAAAATCADAVPLLNNMAPAAESLLPELAVVRRWLEAQPGVTGSLLCGSGACTFALCEDFATACAVVSLARQQGWWARATTCCNAKVSAV